MSLASLEEDQSCRRARHRLAVAPDAALPRALPVLLPRLLRRLDRNWAALIAVDATDAADANAAAAEPRLR